MPDRVLRRSVVLDDHRFLRHAVSPRLTLERHAEELEQSLALLVRSRARDDVYLHAADSLDLVVVDLREDQLLTYAQAVVAAAVEGLRRQAPEVADAGQGRV